MGLKKTKWAMRLIGIVIFIFILTRISLTDVLATIRNADKTIFGSAILIYSLFLLLRVFIWRYLLSLKDIWPSFKDAGRIYIAGTFIGLVTPGRLGDFSKAYFLKDRGHDFIKSFVTVFVERMSDILFLFFIGYLSMFFFSSFFKVQIYILSILIVIAVAVILFLFFNRRILKKFLKKMFGNLIPDKYKKKVKLTYLDMISEIISFPRGRLILSSVLISLSWFVYYAAMYMLTISLSIDVTFTYVVACLAITSLLSMIPITISGIGTRDVALIFLFGLIGLEKEVAVSFSLLILSVMLFAALLGLISWFSTNHKH